MTELVSIIVPFYNGWAYMERCVNSVLGQTYPHFELLLIDDGSRDGSAEAAGELCRTDQRLHLIRLPHGGVSAARNAGIAAAKGTYLFFLDIDDTIHPRLLEALTALCGTTGAAFAAGLYNHVYVGKTAPRHYPDHRNDAGFREWNYTWMDEEEAIRQFSSNRNSFQAIGGKMFRRSEVGSLRFDEKRRNGEDTLFVYDFLSKGKTAVLLREKWYDYWHYSDGASQRLEVRACRDIHECMLYIAANEQAQGRMEFARLWVKSASFRLRKIYTRSWEEHNAEVFAYAKTLAREFRQSGQHALLGMGERCKNFLAYHCFPLYLPIHMVMVWLWRRIERKLIAESRNEEKKE